MNFVRIFTCASPFRTQPNYYSKIVLVQMPSPLLFTRQSRTLSKKKKSTNNGMAVVENNNNNNDLKSPSKRERLNKKTSLSPPSQIYKCFGTSTSKSNLSNGKKSSNTKKIDSVVPERHDPLLLAALLRRRFSKYLRGERKRTSACVHSCLEFEDHQNHQVGGNFV